MMGMISIFKMLAAFLKRKTDETSGRRTEKKSYLVLYKRCILYNCFFKKLRGPLGTIRVKHLKFGPISGSVRLKLKITLVNIHFVDKGFYHSES